MKAQPAPLDATSRYLGVFCINPTCGKPMDVRDAWPMGKFHGVNATQTPTGSRCTNWRTSGWRGGMTRP